MTTYKTADNNRTLMASNLSFNRSIAPSPSLLTGFDSARPELTPQPIILQKIKGRGAFLNSYLDKSGKPASDFDPSKPNIVEGDVANLPPDCDSFRMDFSVNITAGSIAPNTCELPKVDQLIQEISRAYFKKDGYRVLAARYVWRLLSGSMMWRNYIISSDKKVTIVFDHREQRQTLISQCRDLSRTKYPGDTALRDAAPQANVLIDAFAQALAIDGDPLILRVTATGIVGYGGEVYPSQMFTEHRAVANGRTPPKELASYDLGDGRRQGKMNAAKIGNAIRHIDEWHGQKTEGVISVEAYGFVQHNLTALRPIAAANIYNLLWQDSSAYPKLIAESASANDIPGNIHYFMAMLVRGGVFAAPGGSDDTAKKAAKG